MNKLLVISVVLTAILVVGCAVMVPIEWPDPHPFPDSSLQFIKKGETTRAEIREVLSRWEIERDDGTSVINLSPRVLHAGEWWGFPASRRKGQVCWAVFVPEQGEMDCQEAGFDTYRLLIQFESTGGWPAEDTVVDYFVAREDEWEKELESRRR